MKIGVPGEFHEDRWQRTAEDSERCMIPRTREAGGAHRIQVIAWRRGLLTDLRHGYLAHRYSRGITSWRRGLLDGLWHGHHAHSYSGASRRGEEPPEQRQTGLCSMQRPVILSPGLPPDLPDGFIRQHYRPPDRPALPTALPEALAGRVTWVILTAHLTGRFRQPYFPTSRPPDFSERQTERQTASLTGRFRSSGQTGQPHRPATPTSPTSSLTGQPHQ